MSEKGNGAARRNDRQGTKRLSSVTTAIHLMKLFTADRTEMGISELAARLGTAKSTTHRLATTLLREGLLEQNPENDRYRLGFGLFSLGALARARINVATEAKPFLSALRDSTGENARLAVLDRRQIVFMHDIASPQSLGLQSCTGQYRPAHCTAEGLCLLANLPPDLQDDCLTAPLHPSLRRLSPMRTKFATGWNASGAQATRSRMRSSKRARAASPHRFSRKTAWLRQRSGWRGRACASENASLRRPPLSCRKRRNACRSGLATEPTNRSMR